MVAILKHNGTLCAMRSTTLHTTLHIAANNPVAVSLPLSVSLMPLSMDCAAYNWAHLTGQLAYITNNNAPVTMKTSESLCQSTSVSNGLASISFSLKSIAINGQLFANCILQRAR